MAIYHCSVRTFTRSEGHSAVAAAAYRSGSLMRDERTGTMHRYENRSGVKTAFILAPNGVPETILTRAALWNAAEASENRKNSRVAREVILALPHELDDQARESLTRDMGLYLIERYRVAVDVAIHAPVEGDGHDPRNHHAHLLFTTRELTEQGFGAKTRVLDDKTSGPEEIEIIRQVWETLANDALKRAGLEVMIDRRSLEDQGIDRIPQIHEGKAARNAKTSLVTSAFARASDDEDEEGDSDSDGKSGKSKSGSSSKGQNFSANNGQTDAPKNLDRTHPRLTLNDEIKSLNDKRSAFSAKPLPQQMAQLDRMMERLDKRLERLERLERKGTPRKMIQHLIETAIRVALHYLIDRRKTASKLERQSLRQPKLKSRMSKRDILTNKMKDVRQNIEIVNKKKSDLRQYKGLINRIELELKRHQQAEVKSTSADDTRPIVKAAKTEPINPDRITHYKVVVMRDILQQRMTETFKPLRPREELKASTAIQHVLNVTVKDKQQSVQIPAKTQPANPPPYKADFNATAKVEVKPVQKIQTGIEFKLPDHKQPIIVQGTIPPSKTQFNTLVNQQLSQPIQKIKVDLGIRLSEQTIRSASTPASKAQFNSHGHKEPSKPIVKTKTDLNIKIPEPEPPKAKMSFNTASGSGSVKPITTPKPTKRTLN